MQNNQTRRYCTALESFTKKQYTYCSDSNAWTTDWTLTVSYLHFARQNKKQRRWTESAPSTLLTPRWIGNKEYSKTWLVKQML